MHPKTKLLRPNMMGIVKKKGGSGSKSNTSNRSYNTNTSKAVTPPHNTPTSPGALHWGCWERWRRGSWKGVGQILAPFSFPAWVWLAEMYFNIRAPYSIMFVPNWWLFLQSCFQTLKINCDIKSFNCIYQLLCLQIWFFYVFSFCLLCIIAQEWLSVNVFREL